MEMVRITCTLEWRKENDRAAVRKGLKVRWGKGVCVSHSGFHMWQGKCYYRQKWKTHKENVVLMEENPHRAIYTSSCFFPSSSFPFLIHLPYLPLHPFSFEDQGPCFISLSYSQHYHHSPLLWLGSGICQAWVEVWANIEQGLIQTHASSRIIET